MYGVYNILAKCIDVFLQVRDIFWTGQAISSCAQFVPCEPHPGADSKSLLLSFPVSGQCSFLVSAQYSSPGSCIFNITVGCIVKMGSPCILSLGSSNNTQQQQHSENFSYPYLLWFLHTAISYRANIIVYPYITLLSLYVFLYKYQLINLRPWFTKVPNNEYQFDKLINLINCASNECLASNLWKECSVFLGEVEP